VTATQDRRSDYDVEPDVTPWTERPIVGTRRGLPLWGAVLLPFALGAIGSVVDIERSKGPGAIFQAMYLIGCVVAVCAVRRRNIFGPTVQPPLILVVTIPLTVLLVGDAPEGGGLASKALSMATPLINSFPVMAATTVLTIAIGLWRRFKQGGPRTAQDRARAAERRRERAAARRPARDRNESAKQRSSSAAARRGTSTRGGSSGAERRGSTSGRSGTSSKGGSTGGQRGEQGRSGRQSSSRQSSSRQSSSRQSSGRQSSQGRGGRPAAKPRRRDDY
jgi:hypothetical protein